MEEILIDDSFIDSDLINHRGQKYPRILIQNDEIVKPALAPEHLCRDIFVERTDQNLFVRLLRRYRTNGFINMLNFIKQLYHENHDRQSNQKSDDNNPTNSKNYGLLLLYIFALIILQIYSIYLAIHLYFYPFDMYSDDDLFREFNLNLEWKSGLVRTFVWHPSSLQCALSLVNDLIYVYSADHRRPMNHITCLKNVHQRRISSMCWHPKLPNVLAVACRDKILIWRFECFSGNVAQSSLITPFQAESLSTNMKQPSLQIVNTHLQSPITSLAFNANGDMLVSCSPRNAALSLCQFDDKCQLIKTEYIRMKQLSSLIHLPQLTSLQWSPDGHRLLALTTVLSKPICVFESIKWSYKFWSFPCEHNRQLCQTAVWSRPNGMILLFVPKQSSKIYALTFYDQAEPGDVGGCSSDKCTLVLDTRQFFNRDDVTSLPPIIHQICWDCKSTKLVVSFHDPLRAIAIFNTNLNPGLNIQPFRILKPAFTSGLNVRCLLMNFHDNYLDPGCLITICWSNGILTHVPLEADSDKNDRSHNESIRSLTSLCTSFDESSFVRPSGEISLNRRSVASPLQVNSNGSIKSPQTNGCKNSVQPDKTKNPGISSPFRRSVLYSTRIQYD